MNLAPLGTLIAKQGFIAVPSKVFEGWCSRTGLP
jgi:hypothetical protein